MTKKKAALSNIPGKIISFFRESRDELRKVSWPSRQTTVRYTAIVIASSIFVGVTIGGLDYLFTYLLETLLF